MGRVARKTTYRKVWEGISLPSIKDEVLHFVLYRGLD